MTQDEIERAVGDIMEEVRRSPCFDTKLPKATAREFLEQLKCEIDIELAGLQGDETSSGTRVVWEPCK